MSPELKRLMHDTWVEGWVDAVFTASRRLPMGHEQKARMFAGERRVAYDEGRQAGMNAWQVACASADAHVEPKN